MTNVSSQNPEVNAAPIPIADVVTWYEKQAAKSDMGENAARLRITAIHQFTDLVAEDEPKEAAWMLKNVDRLTERWARRNQGAKSDTAKTYATRVRTSIQEYMKWSAAPHEYDPKKPTPKADTPKKAKPAPVVEEAAPVMPLKAAPVPFELMDRVRLGAGRDLYWKGPEDGLFLKDALRTAYALIIASEDYDPSSGTPMQILAQALNAPG